MVASGLNLFERYTFFVFSTGKQRNSFDMPAAKLFKQLKHYITLFI